MTEAQRALLEECVTVCGSRRFFERYREVKTNELCPVLTNRGFKILFPDGNWVEIEERCGAFFGIYRDEMGHNTAQCPDRAKAQVLWLEMVQLLLDAA